METHFKMFTFETGADSLGPETVNPAFPRIWITGPQSLSVLTVHGEVVELNCQYLNTHNIFELPKRDLPIDSFLEPCNTKLSRSYIEQIENLVSKGNWGAFKPTDPDIRIIFPGTPIGISRKIETICDGLVYTFGGMGLVVRLGRVVTVREPAEYSNVTIQSIMNESGMPVMGTDYISKKGTITSKVNQTGLGIYPKNTTVPKARNTNTMRRHLGPVAQVPDIVYVGRYTTRPFSEVIVTRHPVSIAPNHLVHLDLRTLLETGDKQFLAEHYIQLLFKAIRTYFDKDWVHAQPHAGNWGVLIGHELGTPTVIIRDFETMYKVNDHERNPIKRILDGTEEFGRKTLVSARTLAKVNDLYIALKSILESSVRETLSLNQNSIRQLNPVQVIDEMLRMQVAAAISGFFSKEELAVIGVASKGTYSLIIELENNIFGPGTIGNDMLTKVSERNVNTLIGEIARIGIDFLLTAAHKIGADKTKMDVTIV